MDPLYERFGGMEAVARVVFTFYDRVLASRRLAPYFEDVDLGILIDHQTKFLASTMGGPASYTNAHLRKVHAHLSIGDDDFDEMIGLLEKTLREFGLRGEDLDAVLSELRARRPYIVSAGANAGAQPLS